VGYRPDPATGLVIGSAIEVHKTLGPGLLESVYQRCLAYELMMRGVSFAQQVPLAVVYRGMPTDCGYRLDLVIERRLIVESLIFGPLLHQFSISVPHENFDPLRGRKVELHQAF